MNFHKIIFFSNIFVNILIFLYESKYNDFQKVSEMEESATIRMAQNLVI